MILYLPFLVFGLGGVIAYGSAGARRQVGTVLLIAAAAWSLALIDQPPSLAWAIGPLIATVLLRRPAERARSTFEVLTRRTITIAAAVVLALILAARFPFGDDPLLLNAVPWLLGAVGAAWVLSPIDAVERLQGQTLMVAATGALLLAAIPSNSSTAAAAGLAAVMPALGPRLRTPPQLRPLLSSLMLLAAAVSAIAAATGAVGARQSVGDLAINLGGSALLAAAIVLAAGALLSPAGIEWAAVLGAVALIAVAPALRWSALAALIAITTALDRSGERPAWIGLGALAAVPFFQVLAPASWSARGQSVALGIGLVVLLYAARQPLLRVMVLPSSVFLVLMSVASLNPGNLTRFQWIAATGALLLLALGSLYRWRAEAGQTVVLADWLLVGLLLLAVSARDTLGLGAVAVAVLAIDLSIVRLNDIPDLPPGPSARLLQLARSDWPPSATFAGAALAVIAALQASLALGLLAALYWAGVQLTPLVDGRALAAGPERPRSRLRWLGPALGLAVGIAPALVLRMLRL